MTSPPILEFSYRAAHPNGTIERGAVSAHNRDAALALLADRGLFPIQVSGRASTFHRRRAPHATEAALMLRMLADLLDAGLPLTRALIAVAEVAPERWRNPLRRVDEQIRQGRTLSAALTSSDIQLPTLVTGLLQAGEAGGGLPEAVRQAAMVCEETAATRSALRAALAYPMILAVTASISVAFLATTVLPRFAALLSGLGQTLPRSTRAVIATSHFFQHAGPLLIAGSVVIVVAWIRWVTTTSGRLAWHEMLLRLPVIGPVRFAAAASNAARAIATLLQRGLPIAAALAHTARATGDAALASRLARVRQSVVEGARLSRALDTEKAATPTLIRLAYAGEESGQLAAMLAHGARMEHARMLALVQAAVRVLEPLLIVLFGGLIAFVAAALLQAMYSLRPVG